MRQVAKGNWLAFERRLERARVPASQGPDYHKWTRFYLRTVPSATLKEVKSSLDCLPVAGKVTKSTLRSAVKQYGLRRKAQRRIQDFVYKCRNPNRLYDPHGNGTRPPTDLHRNYTGPVPEKPAHAEPLC
jgi:hypothetical protein